MSWKNPIKPKSVPSFNDVMEDKSSVPSFSEVMDEKKNGGESGLEPSAPTTSQSSEDYSGKRPSAYALKPNISPNLTGTPVPATLDEAHKQDNDKSKAVAGNLWNRFLSGIGDMSSGVSDLVFQGMQKIMPNDPYSKGAEQDLKNFRQEGESTIRTATKELAGSNVSPQQEKNFNDNFWTSAVGGLVQTLPAMTLPKGSGFFLQAYDNGLQAIDNTEAGKNLPESTKTIFGVAVGTAQAVIMKLGIDKIFGKNASKAATNLAISTLTKLVKTSEEPITAELFEAALTTAAKSLKSNIINSAVKVGTSAATGFAMGSAIEGSNQLAEAITNKAEGEDIFEPKTWGERFSNIINAGAATAVGGGLLGAATLPFSKTQNYISQKVSEAKSPEDIIALKNELAAKSPEMTPEETDHLNGLIDDYVRVNGKIPDDVPNRKEVADKILEREDVDKTISDKSQQLSTVDEAFKPDISKEISVLNDRSQEINNEITNPTIETKNAEEIKNEIPIPTEETSVTNEGIGDKKIESDKLKEGDKIQWNVFGNEDNEEWTVGKKVKTRGGKDAVILSKQYVESSQDGTTYSKEYADANGIKYTNDPHTIEHTVSLGDLKESKQINKVEQPTEEIKVGELIDKPITYNGERANLYQDGQTVVAGIEGKNKEYELGNINEIKDHPISDYGIGHETSVVDVNDEGNVTVRGDEFKNNFSNPLAAINYDENGNINSVNLETSDGKKRTFRGNIAEDIAYQIHLKEINKNNDTKSEFENFINTDKPTTTEINNAELPKVATKEPTENNAKVSREKAKSINQKSKTEQPIEEHPDIKKLEEQKNDEIKEVSKPDVKLNLVSNKDLVNSKDPVETKRIHDKIKDGYKILKQMVDCL